ncbi:MAG: flagellar hook-basal body protein [Proteobacteria bacterium]|nr:flagellar hook-basal body protein [Pseudomonadota bacterium]
MLDAIHAAQYALNQTQTQLDVTAQNIANVNTPTYKAERYYNPGINSVDTTINAMNTDKRQQPIRYNFAQGNAIYTARPLDIMLKGDGFMRIQWQDHDYYTRLGQLHIGNDGNLYTVNGARVLGLTSTIPNNVEKLSIDTHGIIWADQRQIGQLELVNFTDPAKLSYLSHGMYQATPSAEKNTTEVQVIQGYLEGSNVNNVDSMMAMMQISHDFNASQKVVQTYDEMLNNAINDM